MPKRFKDFWYKPNAFPLKTVRDKEHPNLYNDDWKKFINSIQQTANLQWGNKQKQ